MSLQEANKVGFVVDDRRRVATNFFEIIPIRLDDDIQRQLCFVKTLPLKLRILPSIIFAAIHGPELQLFGWIVFLRNCVGVLLEQGVFGKFGFYFGQREDTPLVQGTVRSGDTREVDKDALLLRFGIDQRFLEESKPFQLG